MKTSVFIGVSLDGFIARPDGAIDWLTGPDNGGGDSAEFGYNDFIATVDVIVMGRKTFETVSAFEKWYYGDKKVVVLSSGAPDLTAARKLGGVVEHLSGSPAEIVSKLKAVGVRHAYVDGGNTIQRFMQAGFIDSLIISRLPVLIGQGISLFGPLPKDVRLHHVSTRTFPGGMVQSEYEVVQGA
jgi:dihydrofolate reductase